MQSSDSRLVTKIRFEIERVIGRLKQFYALDYTRNSKLGYLNAEYRIACAILNFSHVPTVTDKPNTLKVAQILKERSSVERSAFCNPMDCLLTKQTRTKLFQKIELQTINNFPRLDPEVMNLFVSCGTYNLKRSKQYLIDLVTHNVAYKVDKKMLLTQLTMLNETQKKFQNRRDKYQDLMNDILNENSRVVAVEIFSRNHRSEKTPKKCTSDDEIDNDNESNSKKLKKIYKVFICYWRNQEKRIDMSPEEINKMREEDKELETLCAEKREQRKKFFNNQKLLKNEDYKNIKGFICSCMNGKRTVSPCAHVASVIYYLAYAKFNDMKFPAQYLNSIFLSSPNEKSNISK